MGGHGTYAGSTIVHKHIGCFANCSGRIDHVVNNDDILPSTSPITFMSATSFARIRVLWQMINPESKYFAQEFCSLGPTDVRGGNGKITQSLKI